jgi:hypothetical protein
MIGFHIGSDSIVTKEMQIVISGFRWDNRPTWACESRLLPLGWFVMQEPQ